MEVTPKEPPAIYRRWEELVINALITDETVRAGILKAGWTDHGNGVFSHAMLSRTNSMGLTTGRRPVSAPEKGYTVPPVPAPKKSRLCKGPHCKNTTSRANGFCSFDCEDWQRLVGSVK